MKYVLIRSWHVIVQTYRTGAVQTRCGRTGTPVGMIRTATDPIVVHATAEELPLDQRSCETCLRLVAHDAEKKRP